MMSVSPMRNSARGHSNDEYVGAVGGTVVGMSTIGVSGETKGLALAGSLQGATVATSR